VYICICNALTDRKLKEAIATTGSQCPKDVYAACGCRAKCGKCVQVVKDLLHEHSRASQSAMQTADCLL
jgi:bacterioferritin-associated ferredoxin